MAALIQVQSLSKKFCSNLKSTMKYGMLELLRPRTQDLTLRKDEFWALKDVSFELGGGEILGIVGSNGSGKTTLMRIISGIYEGDGGRVIIAPGKKVTPIFALKAGMQQLFTGRENIYIKGAILGCSKEELDSKMSFIESFCELGDKLDTPFGNYSSGMKSRLAYAIAAATDPDIFIIDEALAVGDSSFKTKCFDHLKDFIRSKEKSVLFVSNNIRKILKISTRVIVLKNGIMVEDSTNIKQALLNYIDQTVSHLDTGAHESKVRKIQEFEFE